MTTPSVSEEMIRAGEELLAQHPGSTWQDIVRHVAHLPAGSEAVKPLKWISPPQSLTLTRCDTEFGTYRTWRSEENRRWLWSLEGGGQEAGGEAYWEHEAKAAAQADFERRVLSCLAPPSTPPAANVQELEEQAWNCDHLPKWLMDLVCETNDVADRLDMSSEQAHAYAILRSKQVPTVAVPDDAEITRLEETLGALEGTHANGWINITMEERRLFARLLREHIARAEQRETPNAVVGEG